MNVKKIFILLVISTLFMGSACAANVGDFTVNSNYGVNYDGSYFYLHMNQKQDAGVIIFNNLYTDYDNDAYDGLIHDEGHEYIEIDDDMKVEKNADNTAYFTDYDHAEHGVVEKINVDGKEFLVVFWAKDTSGIQNADLMSQLNEFNTQNNVSPVAF